MNPNVPLFVVLATVFVALTTSKMITSEPRCSNYEYDEKVLSKLLRMEILIEQLQRHQRGTTFDFHSQTNKCKLH